MLLGPRIMYNGAFTLDITNFVLYGVLKLYFEYLSSYLVNHSFCPYSSLPLTTYLAIPTCRRQKHFQGLRKHGEDVTRVRREAETLLAAIPTATVPTALPTLSALCKEADRER